MRKLELKRRLSPVEIGSPAMRPFVTRQVCYRNDDRAMRLIYECPENFWGCEPNLGEEEVVGVADGTIRKSVRDFL